MHLTNQETCIQGLEAMLEGLGEKSQQLAYQMFASIIRIRLMYRMIVESPLLHERVPGSYAS